MLCWVAPAADEGATVNQLLSSVPTADLLAPFSADDEPPVLCPRCDVPARLPSPCEVARTIACIRCNEVYHLVCANLRRVPKKPWKCEACHSK